MADGYRVIGSEESPYSVKVRSYFRYKNIDHEWMDRAAAGDLFAKHARLPLVPLVVTPDDTGIQDSTPIIEAMEERFPTPSIHPDEPTAAFVSALLEEFGDEWGNKWMFHLRWAREIDQMTVSRRFAKRSAPPEKVEETAKAIRERMVPRVWFVGANEVTAPQIEQSFQDTLALVDTHLAGRTHLFGARPAFADFALWGQIYNAGRDPTGGSWVQRHANVVQWIERMLNPAAGGDFEPWADLAPTLTPLLSDQVAGVFLPWSVANAAAIAAGDEEFEVTLKGQRWVQKPQKYHARSLAVLRAKHAAAQGNPELDELLEATGCRSYLK